jgi:hypothetical protein
MLLGVLAMTLAAGCTGVAGTGGLTPSATTTTAIIGWENRLRVEWTATAGARGQDIEGYVYDLRGAPVLNVRLLAQGLDAGGNVVGQKLEWLPSPVPPMNRAYFRIAGMPAAATYRVSVWSYDPAEMNSWM